MNTLDLFFITVLAYAAYKGYRRGMLLCLFTLLAYIAAIIIGIKFMHIGTLSLFKLKIGASPYVPLFSFVFIFLSAYILVFYIGKKIKHLLNYTIVGHIDNIIGAFLNTAKTLVILSLLTWLISFLQFFKKDFLNNSLLYPYISNFVPLLLKNINSLIPIHDWLEDVKKYIIIDYN